MRHSFRIIRITTEPAQSVVITQTEPQAVNMTATPEPEISVAEAARQARAAKAAREAKEKAKQDNPAPPQQ